MPEHTCARIIRPVESDALVIRLELRLAGDTLTGRASDSSGVITEFTGRVGLLAAIDAFIAGASRLSHPR